MEHHEYLYLLFRAHEIKALSREAAARGEEFFPTDAFTKLASGLEAQAIIRPLQPGEPDKCILRLRHPDDGTDRKALVQTVLLAFFPEKFELVPGTLRERGRCEYLAYSDSVPPLPIPAPPTA